MDDEFGVLMESSSSMGFKSQSQSQSQSQSAPIEKPPANPRSIDVDDLDFLFNPTTNNDGLFGTVLNDDAGILISKTGFGSKEEEEAKSKLSCILAPCSSTRLRRHHEAGGGVPRKQICIRATAIDQSGPAQRSAIWYLLTLSSSDYNGTIVEETKSKKRKRMRQLRKSGLGSSLSELYIDQIPDVVTCLSVGSTMYCIGGRISSEGEICFSRTVRVVDMSSISSPFVKVKWKKMKPKMLTRRWRPEAVWLNGKLFVFGGTGVSPWAEAYDSSSGEWKALTPPQQTISQSSLFAFAMSDGSDTILVGDSVRLYTYHVDTDSWTPLESRYPGNSLSGTNLVLVDGHLYWIGVEYIYAYSLETKTLITGPVDPEIDSFLLHNSWPDIMYEPLLFHLCDDKFCFVRIHRKCLPDLVFCGIRCVIFSVVREVDSLRVTTISSRTYQVDYDLWTIEGILLDDIVGYGNDGDEEIRLEGSH